MRLWLSLAGYLIAFALLGAIAYGGLVTGPETGFERLGD